MADGKIGSSDEAVSLLLAGSIRIRVSRALLDVAQTVPSR
jgi:hypothetical protein